MGSALAQRLRLEYRIFIFDKDKSKLQQLKGVNVAQSGSDLIKNADVAILAVKPTDFRDLLLEIKKAVRAKLLISIAAGIKTGYIEKIVPEARVIRVMPNIASRIGKGISCICQGSSSNRKDLKIANKLFKFLGKTFIFEEKMMDAVTSVSGSGPGFWAARLENMPKDKWQEFSVKIFIPEFTKAAQGAGFSSEQAFELATLTTWGALATTEVWHITPQQLKDMVASKGGTTEAGLKVLASGGTLEEAVLAAKKRSEELSKEG